MSRKYYCFCKSSGGVIYARSEDGCWYSIYDKDSIKKLNKIEADKEMYYERERDLAPSQFRYWAAEVKE